MTNTNKAIIFFAFITFIGFGAFLLNQRNSISTSDTKIGTVQEPPSNGDKVGCTEEAKQCPDGSFVVRVLPNCEFEECTQDTLDIQQQVPNDWQKYSNAVYSLYYPQETKIVDSSDNQLILTFMGQKQIDSGRTQTELFDGYSFRIEEISGVDSYDLQAVANQERDNAEEHCFDQEGTVLPVSMVKIASINAYQYSAIGCRVDYTETIISRNDIVYRVSQTYVGDNIDQPKYKEITDIILSSLELL